MLKSILHQLNGYEVKRKKMLQVAPPGALKDFLSQAFPAPDTPLSEANLLALDFETTGLDAVTDKLLSVGFVQVKKREIHLGTSYHQIVRSKADLDAENVAIHQITDAAKDSGLEFQPVVEELLQALAGKVLLVHYHKIERSFLQQACLLLYGMAPVIPIIDTLVIAKRKLDLADVAYDPSCLRLSNLRDTYGLPNHYAHNALNDALATAELLLAQTAGQPEIKLKQLLL